MVRTIVRLESLLVFLICLIAFAIYGANWWLFLAWILPDIGIVGFLKNAKFGDFTYNFSHNYLFSTGIILLGIGLENDTLTALGIIFCSHVALDRLLGFGLKYPGSFKDTQIQKL